MPVEKTSWKSSKVLSSLCRLITRRSTGTGLEPNQKRGAPWSNQSRGTGGGVRERATMLFRNLNSLKLILVLHFPLLNRLRIF